MEKPIRSNLYWAKYWLKMKRKTKSNNFDENARRLRNTIFGVAWMTGSKTEEDEEAVKILDMILNDAICDSDDVNHVEGEE